MQGLPSQTLLSTDYWGKNGRSLLSVKDCTDFPNNLTFVITVHMGCRFTQHLQGSLASLGIDVFASCGFSGRQPRGTLDSRVSPVFIIRFEGPAFGGSGIHSRLESGFCDGPKEEVWTIVTLTMGFTQKCNERLQNGDN